MAFRTIVGSLIIAALGGGIAIDVWLFDPLRPIGALVIAALGILCWGEFARITSLRGGGEKASSRALDAVGGFFVLYFLAVAFLFGQQRATGAPAFPASEPQWQLWGVVGVVVAAFSVAIVQRDLSRSYRNVLEVTLGSLWVGLLIASLLSIYKLPGGRGPILLAVLIGGIKGGDSVAYYVGKSIGRRRIFPVSPKKTLEGSLGALAFSALYFSLAGRLLEGLPGGCPFSWRSGILWGLLLSLLSQLGDFAESLLKRCYQVKDSGSLLPEFGGVFDMIDSLLFAGFVFRELSAIGE